MQHAQTEVLRSCALKPFVMVQVNGYSHDTPGSLVLSNCYFTADNGDSLTSIFYFSASQQKIGDFKSRFLLSQLLHSVHYDLLQNPNKHRF